jgi:hypothetical protein
MAVVGLLAHKCGKRLPDCLNGEQARAATILAAEPNIRGIHRPYDDYQSCNDRQFGAGLLQRAQYEPHCMRPQQRQPDRLRLCIARGTYGVPLRRRLIIGGIFGSVAGRRVVNRSRVGLGMRPRLGRPARPTQDQVGR